MREPPHRDAVEAEPELRPELRQRFVGPLAAGGRVAEDADLVTACDLPASDVENMAEQPSERRPEDVQDPQGRLGSPDWCQIGQNQRSLMTIVSPGLIG